MSETVDIVGTKTEGAEKKEESNASSRKKKRTTNNVCTKFERARIIAYWAQQLSLGAQPFTDPGNCVDALTIAEQDLDSGKLGEEIIVRRYLPDGSQEDWLVKELKQVRT